MHTRHRLGAATQQQFTEALDRLVQQVKLDQSILAVILCGSLSHDAVWAKSDIDLVFVTIDDKKVDDAHMSLYADGMNVHAMLVPRTSFRRMVEGSLRNSFVHSLLSKGRLLYTHDESIAALCARLHEIGERDTEVQLLHAGIRALGPLYKAHKFLLTRGDLEYTALWLLYAATPLAQVEVISRRLLADREVIPQALALNPEVFRVMYTDLLNSRKTTANVEAALATADAYLADRAPRLFAPVIQHLREVGEARSCTEIDAHFARTMGVEGATAACEYLADIGLIGKAATSARLTRKSHVDVQELAFYSLTPPVA
ncbi:MAG: hypothetical protein U0132_01900 [Gemmatimonadaceae bacterium]